MARDQVFISYSRKDKKWLEQLQTMLAPLIRGGIKIWADTDIKPGQDWKAAIEKALESTKVAVLLVSPDFLASRFIHENELPLLLNAAKQEGLTIIWVPVKHSMYEHSAIAPYQAAHPPDKPLVGLNSAQRGAALRSIAKKIAEALLAAPPNAAPAGEQAVHAAGTRHQRETSVTLPVEKTARITVKPGHDHRFGHDKRTAPMSSLDKSNIQKIVDLLTPHMEREYERRALLILALGIDTPLLSQLDLTVPVGPFLVSMIKALVDYGEVAPGKQALWALLETIRERVGVDRQATIDALYAVISALGRKDDQGLNRAENQ